MFVIDRDGSTHDSLAALIESAGWHPRAFPSAEAFLADELPDAPGCIVLDVAGPDLADLQKLIASRRAGLPIIFVTRTVDVQMAVRAMKAGAAEFLTKPVPRQALLDAIGSAIARSVVEIEAEAQMRLLRRNHDSLSQREQEVLSLIVRGMLNKQVAWELGISEITVKAHRGKVMRKMRAGSFADLVRIADRLDLSSQAVQRAY